MPTSWVENIGIIMKCVLATNPSSVLDLGLGSGKYGFLIREQTDFMNNRMPPDSWRITIDGVEGFGDYIQDHQRSIYNRICIADALEFLTRYEGPPYDVALAIDIIEHFQPWDAARFATHALQISRYLIISTPRDFFDQAIGNNDLERHKSWWPTKALKGLARINRARIRVFHEYRSSIAILSKECELPRIKIRRFKNSLRYLSDLLLPELPFYTLKGSAGSSILNTPPPSRVED